MVVPDCGVSRPDGLCLYSASCPARRWRFVLGYMKIALKGYKRYFDAYMAVDSCVLPVLPVFPGGRNG